MKRNHKIGMKRGGAPRSILRSTIPLGQLIFSHDVHQGFPVRFSSLFSTLLVVAALPDDEYNSSLD